MTADPARPPAVRARLLYSVEEAAELLGIGRTFTYELVAAGEIESMKVGKRRKIPHDALTAFIQRLRSQQSPATGYPMDGRTIPAAVIGDLPRAG